MRLFAYLSRKDLSRQSGFDPITFTFSENSNYWRESLLEVSNKAKTLLGDVNKLLKTKSLLTAPSNALPFTPQANFPAHNLNFH